MKAAILGGKPQFENRLGIVAPKLPALSQIAEPLAVALESGQLTNHARYVPLFEQALREQLACPQVITVVNGTLAIILLLEALKRLGEVILPSFTYCATAHALYWSGHIPVFVDILPDTFTMDPAAVEAAITPQTAAIMGVHIFGHPCEIDALQAIANRNDIPLIFDAAHAFGSQYKGQPIGNFGQAETFSFHATKVFPTGEGGCITTTNQKLGKYLALARKFGDPGDENTRFPGMNAKMQEFNAIVGLEMLKVVDEHISNRREYASYLIERLGQVPGITFQTIRPDVFTNYQNFAFLIDEAEFGLDRDQLFEALVTENIIARKYFYPSIHQHQAYRQYHQKVLPVTEQISQQVLCLPFYSEMSTSVLEGICEGILKIQTQAPQIRKQRQLKAS